MPKRSLGHVSQTGDQLQQHPPLLEAAGCSKLSNAVQRGKHQE